MHTLAMSPFHSTPFHRGSDGFEQLAPLRPRSTSPLHRPTGVRARTPAEGPEDSTGISYTHIGSHRSTNQPVCAMRAPWSSASEQSSSAHSSIRSRNQSHLQPGFHSVRQSHAIDYGPGSGRSSNYHSTHPTHASRTTSTSPFNNRQDPQSFWSPPEQRIDPPWIEEPPHAHLALLGHARNTRGMSSTSSPPVPPRYLSHLEQRHDIPENNRPFADHRQSTFVSAHDFGLFAEALTGLGPEPSPNAMPSTEMPRSDSISHHSAAPASRGEHDLSHSVSIGPEPVHRRNDPWSASRRSPPSPPYSSSSEAPAFNMAGSVMVDTPQAAFQHDLALSGALSGLGINEAPRDDDVNDGGVDDELPDYEQSQREAADQARFKALRRARELESRWAASVPHQMN